MLGLAASWTTAGTTVATMLLPLLVLAIPILDTTLVTIRRLVERRPVTQGGKDHTSHRLVYFGLSERKAVGLLAIIAVALGATSVAYNILDDARVTAVGVLLTFVLLVQFGGFLERPDERTRRGEASDTSLRHALTFEPRRLVEVLVDFVLVCTSFLAAYLIVVGGKGTELQRSVFLGSHAPSCSGCDTWRSSRFGSTGAIWRYARRAGRLAIAVAVGISAVLAFLVIRATRSSGLPRPCLRRRRDHLHGARDCLAGSSSGFCPSSRCVRRRRRGAGWSSSAQGARGAASCASSARTRRRRWSRSSTTTRPCAAAGSRASPSPARRTRSPGS